MVMSVVIYIVTWGGAAVGVMPRFSTLSTLKINKSKSYRPILKNSPEMERSDQTT